MASAKKRPPPALPGGRPITRPPPRHPTAPTGSAGVRVPGSPGFHAPGSPRSGHCPPGPPWALPESGGPPAAEGGDLLAAGSNRLQTRFRHLYTGSWASLDRSTAGPGPEDHLDLFMSAGSRGQLAPGPAAVRPACQLAPLLAHWTLPPWSPCPPGLPGLPPPPRAHVPPACQLAPFSRRGLSLWVAGPVDRAHVVDFTKSRWMHNWPLCLHARRTRRVPGVSEPSPSTAPALPGSLMGVFSQIEPRIGLTLSDS